MNSADDLLSRLHPVTGPELTPADPTSPWAWWTAVTLVALLGIGIVLFWRRRGLQRSIPANAEARAALTKLPEQPTVESLAEFDRIARQYLGRTCEVPADRLTTPELMAALTNGRQAWREVLEPCDRGRFSGALPTQAAWSELVRRAASLIQADGEDLADQ